MSSNPLVEGSLRISLSALYCEGMLRSTVFDTLVETFSFQQVCILLYHLALSF